MFLPPSGDLVTAGHASQTLLRDLEPVVETNLNRHLEVAKEWFPHEYVPWSEGTNFDGVLGGKAWEPNQSRLSDVARTSLILNLLTEDNLPSYHHEIAVLFGDCLFAQALKLAASFPTPEICRSVAMATTKSSFMYNAGLPVAAMALMTASG